MRGLEKNYMKRGQETDRYLYRLTLRLYDRIGPVGRFDENHEKVKSTIASPKLTGENYLTCGLFNNKQISILFNLRCKTVKNFKNNFHKMFEGDIACPLQLCTK